MQGRQHTLLLGSTDHGEGTCIREVGDVEVEARAAGCAAGILQHLHQVLDGLLLKCPRTHLQPCAKAPWITLGPQPTAVQTQVVFWYLRRA